MEEIDSIDAELDNILKDNGNEDWQTRSIKVLALAIKDVRSDVKSLKKDFKGFIRNLKWFVGIVLAPIAVGVSISMILHFIRW